MQSTVYIETSVVSYLISNPSRDLVTAGHQQITREWWLSHLPKFRAYISELVFREASGGDQTAAKKRLDAVKDFPMLELTEDVLELAGSFIKKGPIPKNSIEDALHIAIATNHGIDYLVTWNCAHIANAQMRMKIAQICREFGYECPTICTPEELMGGS